MIKKIGWLCFFVLLLVGCDSSSTNQSEVVSFIEQNDRITVSMHYPVTGISKFDEMIQDYIDDTYQSFCSNYSSFIQLGYQPELNIDYTYHEVNERYLNVTLRTFVSAGDLAHPILEIHTFVFDKKNNRLLTLEDFIDQDTLKKMIPVIQQSFIFNYKDCLFLDQLASKINLDYSNYSHFTIQDQTFTFYFNPYEISSGNCGIVQVDVPFDEYSLLLPISSDQTDEIFYEYTPVSKIIDPEKPVIALTFDDGPSKYTREIGEVLAEYDASATFFILGNKVELYAETLQMLLKNGNELGNHSYNHKWLTRLSDEDFHQQIDQTNKLVYELFHYDIQCMRPTYGAVNQKLRDSCGLDVVMWDIDTRDWSLTDSKKIAKRAIDEAGDGKIILMHDTRQRTLDAVKILVPELTRQGYQFVTIQELKEVQFIRQQESYE